MSPRSVETTTRSPLVLEGDHFLRRLERDQIGRTAAGGKQRAMQIGAVDDRIRIFETGQKFLAENDFGDFLAGDAVAHHQHFRKDGELSHVLGDAELLEHAKDIGAELDSRADLAEDRRLLEQP